ncbi:MAG TPA: hypothetical protein VFV79_10970 [Saprospiraceae bacterium]|nr:hypothetical protein [Saprospiraceae bacterium]
MPSFSKVIDEIGHLSLIISLPQLISAPIIVILISLFSPIPTPKDVIEIIDFLVISFPLTVAVALITLLVRTDQNSFLFYIGAIVGAAILSNLLHGLLSTAFPAVDISTAYHEAFDPGDLPTRHGAGTFVAFAMNILSLYWKKFGVILFIQSCVIGIYAGTKYFKLKAKAPY